MKDVHKQHRQLDTLRKVGVAVRNWRHQQRHYRPTERQVETATPGFGSVAFSRMFTGPLTVFDVIKLLDARR